MNYVVFEFGVPHFFEQFETASLYLKERKNEEAFLKPTADEDFEFCLKCGLDFVHGLPRCDCNSRPKYRQTEEDI